jgi:hypothetical protein
LFPYALVAVCALWRDILLTFPKFWKQIVVFLGYNPSWLSDFRSELEASRDAMIKVFVMRDRSRTLMNQDVLEEEHMCAVMDVLRLHVHRCTQLSFFLHQTSSLPSVWKEFDHLPHLLSLKLSGKSHREKLISGPTIPDAVAGREFIPPNLGYLAIDG